MNLNDLYEMRDPRDAYQRDVDNSTSGFGKNSYAYQMDGGANDENHALDQQPTWYIRLNGKLIRDKQGNPYKFRDKAAANKAALTMQAKLFNQGKEFMLTTNPNDKPQGVEEGYYDLNSDLPGMEPIDFSSNPSFKELITRYTQLVYQGHTSETSPEEDQEHDAIEQYVAKRFGEKGSAHLQKAAEVSYWGRDDGKGSGHIRSSNLGWPSMPGGNFRTTKAGKMHKQDVGSKKDIIGSRLGRHPEPTLPEGTEFGANYAEQLAQKLFNQDSALDNADTILDLGYDIAKVDLGARAQGVFRDEDFPSDFVSAYHYLKKQGVAEGEKVGNMDADKFDDALSRMKKLAGAGPMKTVWDPEKRVYKNIPTAVQPKK